MFCAFFILCGQQEGINMDKKVLMYYSFSDCRMMFMSAAVLRFITSHADIPIP